MLIFLAGLQAIPDGYYEAAEIDGQTVYKFWYVTVPLLSPTTFFVTVMSIINSFQVFDAVFLMTQVTCQSTSVIVHYIYEENAFQFFRMGYASAMAYILFFMVASITFILFWASEKQAVY